MRVLVRDQLECLLPGCTDRRLHLVNRHGGRRQQRDGFRHTSGTGGHSPESLFHEQAKRRVQQWLRDSRPDLQVELEGATADRSRRADVMVTWPDGRIVAIEIQYSPLSINDWLRRHRSYKDQGITDVWLFGNNAIYLGRQTTSRRGRPRIDLSALLGTCVDEGVPISWINPVEGTVATPYIELRLPEGTAVWRAPVMTGSMSPLIAVDRLDQTCTIDAEHGLTTPTLRAARAERAAYDQALVEWNEMESWEGEGDLDQEPDARESHGRAGSVSTVQDQLFEDSAIANEDAYQKWRRRVSQHRKNHPERWTKPWK